MISSLTMKPNKLGWYSIDEAMLLKGYTLKIEFPACDFSAQTVNAIAELYDDIAEVLPYLNTVVKGCTYLPDAGILRFTKDGKVINIYPNKIAIGIAAMSFKGLEMLLVAVGFAFQMLTAVTFYQLFRRTTTEKEK